MALGFALESESSRMQTDSLLEKAAQAAIGPSLVKL